MDIKKVGVIGPGIVGMPMAALLANARIKWNNKYTEIVVVQRDSVFSGWKVGTINSGHSTIGGIEPDLDNIVASVVSDKILRASHCYSELKDADVVLVCVQTDKKKIEPDYEPLFESLNELAKTLREKPAQNKPVIIFESTLAPSTMETLIKPFFEKFGLYEGKDILLGNSPNRVMPGRLVNRVVNSDKIVGGLSPETPEIIKNLYSNFIKGNIYKTNSLTAEIVKTLENAYRDVRIAFSTELVRYCDKNNYDFYKLRNEVNKLLQQTDSASENPNAVPSGAVLIPSIGVGGHCLPKDGILLWWRKLEAGEDSQNSLILTSRLINNESPSESINLAQKKFQKLNGKKVTLLGAAYRFNSEDTRNSPSLTIANILLQKGCNIRIHDPFVKPGDQNLTKLNLNSYFTNDLESALIDAEYIIICTAHNFYLERFPSILEISNSLKGIFDGCNLLGSKNIKTTRVIFSGIGKGEKEPPKDFIEFAYKGFQIVEKGFANEIVKLIKFFNDHFVKDEFNKVKFIEVQKLASTCTTGCKIVDPGMIEQIRPYNDFLPKLIKCAFNASD